MRTENDCQDTILVRLSALPEMLDELDSLTARLSSSALSSLPKGSLNSKTVSEDPACDVVVDFSNVDIITTPVIARLMALRKLLVDCGRRLVLHSAAQQIKGVFTTTGLDQIFEFADDKPAALAHVRRSHSRG
jgi:anti-anti-sigma regulatory factor